MRFKNKKIRNLFLIFCVNNLVSYFVKWSTFLLTAMVSGAIINFTATDFQAQYIADTSLFISRLLFMASLVAFITGLCFDSEKWKKSSLVGFQNFVFLTAVASSIGVAVTKNLLKNIIIFYAVYLAIFFANKYLLPRLTEFYILKNVLNKEYLGIRKKTEPLLPINNMFIESEITDVVERMVRLNQESIKPAYQEGVELSYLNKENIAGVIHFRTVNDVQEKKTFEDFDTKYTVVFTISPFESISVNAQLIKLVLSKKDSFTSIEEIGIK